MQLTETDIFTNRSVRKWSRRELAGRLLWTICGPLFRWSPRLCWGWRRTLLRLFGARIGSGVHIHPSAAIFIPWNLEIGDMSSIGFGSMIYNLGPLRIGARVTVSQRTHLCGGTHDHKDPSMPLVKCPIEIGDDSWICADAFIGPSVRIGAHSIVAAAAVVVRDVPSATIVAGNPAKPIRSRT
jgi:putative colanic acid biosynthesis acetyltransferase WcaF